MKVQYVGETQEVEVWYNHSTKSKYTIVKDSLYETNLWDRIGSVLTEKDEWICDVDSPFFKDNFIII